jgi:hypothetical protein
MRLVFFCAMPCCGDQMDKLQPNDVKEILDVGADADEFNARTFRYEYGVGEGLVELIDLLAWGRGPHPTLAYRVVSGT